MFLEIDQELAGRDVYKLVRGSDIAYETSVSNGWRLFAVTSQGQGLLAMNRKDFDRYDEATREKFLRPAIENHGCTLQDLINGPSRDFHGWKRVDITPKQHSDLFQDPVFQRLCVTIPDDLRDHLKRGAVMTMPTDPTRLGSHNSVHVDDDGYEFIGTIGSASNRRVFFVK